MIRKYFESFWNSSKLLRKNQILDLLENSKSTVFLDCGCDDGTFTVALSHKLKTKYVYGVEINKIALKKAKKKGIKVKESDLNFKFPFPNNFFDVIVADQVIEHLWDLDNFALEIYRILKPKGYAIISTENLASWHNIAALIFGLQPFTGPTLSKITVLGFHPLTPNINVMKEKSPHTPTMPPHTKVMTLTALVSLFRIYNFDIEKVLTSGYFPFFGLISRILSLIDKRHSFFITIKARKN